MRTLGAVQRTVELIKQRHGITIDINKIPLNDEKAMKLIKSGFTDGIFQVESSGMKSMFRSMKRVAFDDVVAGISLYRPGPMQFIPQYISRLNGMSEVEYLFPELEPILKDTYGILIYQEQVMKIAKEIAGFNWIEVDGYRKAIGKKIESKIRQMNDWLINGHKEGDIDIPGLVAKGIPKDVAEKLTDDLVEFGKYCFNKSHAAGYAKLVVITAYLKAHYPLEYMAPLISSYIGKDQNKIVQYIHEAKRMGIQLLRPDINHSSYDFVIEDNKIRFGLGAIKGLDSSALGLINERIANGTFTSIEELMDRIQRKALNKKSLSVLAMSGAMDSFIEEKESRFDVLRKIFEVRAYGDPTPFIEENCPGEVTESFKKIYFKSNYDQHGVDEMISSVIEQSLLGVYLSTHPLDGKAEPLCWDTLVPGERFDVVGIIKSVRQIQTRFGKPMAFINLETLEGVKDITVFTKEFESLNSKFEVGAIKTITLEHQLKGGEASFLLRNIKNYKVKGSVEY